jgi:hypothetical protein
MLGAGSHVSLPLHAIVMAADCLIGIFIRKKDGAGFQ